MNQRYYGLGLNFSLYLDENVDVYEWLESEEGQRFIQKIIKTKEYEYEVWADEDVDHDVEENA